MSIRKTVGITAVVLAVGVVAYNLFGVMSPRLGGVVELRMAHAAAGSSDISKSIDKISDFAAENKDAKLKVIIYPSGVLGTEKETIEMVKAGVLDMAKVGSNTMVQFKNEYSIFSMPYLFVSQDHYYKAMEQSEEVKKLFESTADQGYIAIGYYANGSRNFYIKEQRACDSPEVLKGKKIRSTPSATSMLMIEKMGGSPVPMSAGETYTALQQGVVDGAENTELALTVNGHEDLVKSYTYTEHQYSPDIYLISTKVWNKLSDLQKQTLIDAINKANANFKKLYNGMMADAIKEAEEHGVTIYRNIDKTAFIKAVQPMHAEFKEKGQSYSALYDDIQKYQN
ncbi:MAG: TRAP transporter substrate-binding protein DctP [Succinivibrio sp.]|nr:TRAP transporter substrate-binding protein DctP [Succinivibrio sp.]